MKSLVIALVGLALTSPASFAARGRARQPDYGFDWFKLTEKSTCEHIDGETIDGFKCEPTDMRGEGANPYLVCTSKNQKSEYLIFKTKHECELEIEAQKANIE